MASSSLILKKWQALIRDLFPRGVAWQQKEDQSSNMRKLFDSLGFEPCRIEERGFELINEVFPDTTCELLTDWERLLNLPDECEPDPINLSKEDRRNRIIQVITTLGGQNIAFYQELVSNFGIPIGVIDVNDQPPFRVGQSRVGDRLTNGPWRYTFIVTAPIENATVFRTGLSRVGQPLRSFSNPTVECLINKHKPAHTIALFAFIP